MFLVPINYLAVLVCGVAAMGLGFAWYGPLFGKEWEKMVGMTKEKMEKAKATMPKRYGLMFVSSLVMAYVLDHFIWYAAPGNVTLLIGVKTAVWAWLGMIATFALSRFVFSPEQKPVKLLFVETGYYLVTLVVMGAILAILR